MPRSSQNKISRGKRGGALGSSSSPKTPEETYRKYGRNGVKVSGGSPSPAHGGGGGFIRKHLPETADTADYLTVHDAREAMAKVVEAAEVAVSKARESQVAVSDEEFKDFVTQERKSLSNVVTAARKAVSDAVARAEAAEAESHSWKTLLFSSNKQRREQSLQMQRRVLARWGMRELQRACLNWIVNTAVAQGRGGYVSYSVRSGMSMSESDLRNKVTVI